ncbi:S-layer homology domain-containing protein [Cellulosilyticum ruminicola]|uniref:S-layer homology domain-containing protein n=1 Tax=Cellulosilyticum ruminicola TaxID=425254 RepID=UPI0006D0822E|nr:S-layer homology domain-containing protein [Cellulosilyticum ruminicola]
MSRKIMSKWLMVLGLSVIFTVNAFAAIISDVSSSHWAYSSIVGIEKKGYMSVNSSGNFFPNATMNFFEVADVMAKATGYVDVEVNKNIDETFKNQIIDNYNKQKTTLATYAKKYSAWNKLYDQQVAYLLGRGYISTADLDKVVTASGKVTMTKQDLAVFIVRYLGKETTAKNTYKTTGYADEASIKEANRPHVAYLKTLGLVSGSGNFSPDTKVTRALCAKMFNDAINYKVKLNSQTNTGGTTTTNNTNTGGTNNTINAASEQVTIKKVLSKNANEYYVSLTRGNNTSYYTIKNTVKVLNAEGKQISVLDIQAETKANVTIALENGTEYITSMNLVNTNTANNNTTNVITDPNTNTSNTATNIQTVSGTLLEQVSNGIMRIVLTDGTIKAYVLDINNITFLNGVIASADDIAVGDKVTVTLQDNAILKVHATSSNTGATTNNSNVNNSSIVFVNDGEVTKKTFTTKGYIFTVKNGANEMDITVPTSAKVTRNTRSSEVAEIRVGDTIAVTKDAGIVTEVKATGTRKKVEGTLNSMTLAATSTITVKTAAGLETYVIAGDAEFYNQKSRKYIILRDLHLGQSLDIVLDSKEAISIDVESSTSSANYKAKIVEVGQSYSYIDVIIDYDPISGESQVPKRIYTPVNLQITLDGKTQSRSVLEDGMELVITYEYLDDTAPQKIRILK